MGLLTVLLRTTSKGWRKGHKECTGEPTVAIASALYRHRGYGTCIDIVPGFNTANQLKET